MPNRIIREGILTSPKLAKLGWGEEVFYRRLLSVVDDFGRYYADPGMLRAACYPRQLNKVSDSDVGKWLAVCAEAALVRVYPAEDGERYLEVVKFDQQVRAKKSKFPQPPDIAKHLLSKCLADDGHVQSNAHLDVVVDEVVKNTAPAKASAVEGGFARFWEAYPKKKSKGDAEKAFVKLKPSEQLLETILVSIGRAKTSKEWTKDDGQFIPYPASWLNAKGWEDEFADNGSGPQWAQGLDLETAL